MGELGGHRPGLISARRRLGLTQEEAAERLGVSPTTWARWEQGVQGVRAQYRARMVKLFDTTPEEVERWIEDRTDLEPFPWLTATGGGRASLPDTVRATCELWSWDVDPAQRDLLATMPFVPSFLTEWLLSWSLDPAARTRAHRGPCNAVGLEDVHRIHVAIDSFAAMDHQFGGGLVRPAIVDYLNSQVAPLLKGSYSDEVGAQLLAAAASMTTLAGWEAYDLARHGLAQVHYGQALRLAKAADDQLIAAWVLTKLAQQAIDLRHPEWAVRLARAARQAGQRARACARVKAGLLVREARATALMLELTSTQDKHTAGRVHRLIGLAETAFTEAGPDDDEPKWIQMFGAAELSAEAGCAWRMVGDHEKARTYAESALAGFDARYTRSIQFNKIHRAQALLGQGELDAAIAAAREGVPMANSLTSTRSISLVRDFDRELNVYHREARVREWREYLRSELRTVAA